MSTTTVMVKELPDALKRALGAVGYKKRDVDVKAATSTVVGGFGGDGRRSFSVIVNMASGENKVFWGSWGGPNMFSKSNPIDSDQKDHPIPPNGAVIAGMGGTNADWATIYVHPSSLAPLLGSDSNEKLSRRDRLILYYFRAYTSAGRKDVFSRRNGEGEDYFDTKVTEVDLDSLASRGYLTKNKAGAFALTIKGKNLVNDINGPMSIKESVLVSGSTLRKRSYL